MADPLYSVGDYEVGIERILRMKYLVRWVLAVPLSALLMDQHGELAPHKEYRVYVRPSSGGGELWVELSQDLAAADLAAKMAEQIDRIGIDDFLFKKEHGWRID